jgi:hypothetical protein
LISPLHTTSSPSRAASRHALAGCRRARRRFRFVFSLVCSCSHPRRVHASIPCVNELGLCVLWSLEQSCSFSRTNGCGTYVRCRPIKLWLESNGLCSCCHTCGLSTNANAVYTCRSTRCVQTCGCPHNNAWQWAVAELDRHTCTGSAESAPPLLMSTLSTQ